MLSLPPGGPGQCFLERLLALKTKEVRAYPCGGSASLNSAFRGELRLEV